MNQKRYSIAEASDILGYKPHVIRYYEKEFNLKIPRNNVNHRYFTENEIHMLRQIKELQERGYNNTQIKMILKSSNSPTQQIYAQLEGIAATASELNSLHYDEAFRVVIGSIIESDKNEIIGELKEQLESLNKNITAALSELSKKVDDLSLYVENLDSK